MDLGTGEQGKLTGEKVIFNVSMCTTRKKRKGLDAAVDDLKTKAFEFFERVKCAFKDSPYYSYNDN